MSNKRKGLKSIAVFEATKGILALLVGVSAHALAGQNIQNLSENILAHLHLNPAKHFPGIIINAAKSLSVSHLHLLAVGAIVYSLVRFMEAYGLWKGLRWVEWFALISGALYVPFELYELTVKITGVGILILSINLLVVAYLGRELFIVSSLKSGDSTK
jgi:uncharacterized membrane protein (DUF2068 family)